MQDFACDGKSLDSFQFFSTFLDVAMICSARWHCSVCYSAAVIHEVCHLCNVREVQQHRVHVWVLMSLFISHQDCTDYWTSKGAKWTRNTGTLGRVWNLLWRLDHWRLVKWCFLVFISFHTISTHLKHQNALVKRNECDCSCAQCWNFFGAGEVLRTGNCGLWKRAPKPNIGKSKVVSSIKHLYQMNKHVAPQTF